MPSIDTEYVFVCSPNYWRFLHLCLRTLFASGTDVTVITVYVVGEESKQFDFADPRITVRYVPDIGGDYWGANKLHLCQSTAQRVVYLDADVAVLRPIETIWQDEDADLIARPGVGTYTDRWRPELWSAALASAGAPDYPNYSPGFMIFQNGSHRRLGDTWMRLTREILEGKHPLPANRLAEMYAFSIAASIEGLSHTAMADHHHRYAMIGETADDAVVWHLGTPGFYRHYLPLERAKCWHKRRDLPVPRPGFTRLHALQRRVRHRMRSRLLGKRDTRLAD